MLIVVKKLKKKYMIEMNRILMKNNLMLIVVKSSIKNPIENWIGGNRLDFFFNF